MADGRCRFGVGSALRSRLATAADGRTGGHDRPGLACSPLIVLANNRQDRPAKTLAATVARDLDRTCSGVSSLTCRNACGSGSAESSLCPIALLRLTGVPAMPTGPPCSGGAPCAPWTVQLVRDPALRPHQVSRPSGAGGWADEFFYAHEGIRSRTPVPSPGAPARSRCTIRPTTRPATSSTTG